MVNGQCQQRFHNSLKRLRRERGLTQKEIAHLLGYKSASLISRWEKGLLPDTLNCIKLVSLYETGVDGIFFDLYDRISAEISRKQK